MDNDHDFGGVVFAAIFGAEENVGSGVDWLQCRTFLSFLLIFLGSIKTLPTLSCRLVPLPR